MRDEKIPTLLSQSGPCGVTSQFPHILDGLIVRRITPRECERLQGFEDDYTLIPWRGAMSSDHVRYRAIGNSWAVPNVRWIGKRILEVESVLKELA